MIQNNLLATNNDRKYYTVSELAEILPLGRNSLYKLVGRSDFPKVTIGRKILIPATELDKYIRDHLYAVID